ncbi:unnamed protein product [Linum trigynum]|uniref:RNase H type-1 domain-containing protein n=1 Tax=Linum trigynum TaxID=586398 RepID=A0AAV2CTY4_9ROSI
MQQYHLQYHEWISLPVDRSRGPPIPIPPVVDHPDNPITCMWDGATRSASHSADNMVVKSQTGGNLMARGLQFRGIYDPLDAEALALREAILWCWDSSFAVVRFEGDAKVLIHKINSRMLGLAEWGR